MKNNMRYCFAIFCLSLQLILISSLMTSGQDSAPLITEGIDGVYEFVSQQTTITKPRRQSRIISAPEWVGTWQLSQGSFSTILMRKKRTKFADREKYDEDYDSFGGTYTIEGRILRLIPIYALRPGTQDRPIVVEFEMNEDMLILTQFLRPFIEDMREGTVVTTLKKSNPGVLSGKNED